MAANYYNSITIVTKVEQPFSIYRKMDQWGAQLIEPRRAEYNGRVYEINMDEGKVSVREEVTSQSKQLTIRDKIAAAIGVALKKIAAYFDKRIQNKYQFIDQRYGSNEASSKDKLSITDLLPKRKVEVIKPGEGKSGAECLVCCAVCCECCCDILDPQPRCRGRRYC